MMDLLAWIVFGGVIGFIYAWKRLAKGGARARQIIESTPFADAKDRARAIDQNFGFRVGGALLFAAFGAVAGAAIWGAASLLLLVSD